MGECRGIDARGYCSSLFLGQEGKQAPGWIIRNFAEKPNLWDRCLAWKWYVQARIRVGDELLYVHERNSQGGNVEVQPDDALFQRKG